MSRLNEKVYRDSEQNLFAECGVEVREHRIEVGVPTTSIQVLEIGEGDPVLFLHGSPNSAATWTSLAAQLVNHRCVLLERPGAGLSTPVVEWGNHRESSVSVVESVLDALDIEEVHLVGSSFGGLYAYNFALAHAKRVRSIVQLGAPAGPSILGMPPLFRFLSLPLPKVMTDKALRADSTEARDMFTQIGHGTAIETGVISDTVLDWYSALLCNTDTVANLFTEIRAIATPFGFRESSRIDDELLGEIAQPMLYLWGDRDTFAKAESADALAALTPQATIEHFDGFGHLPWYDDPTTIAHRIGDFLSRS